MIKRKNNFTLLEIVIALFLISIIMTYLFGFFTKVLKIETDIEKKKEQIFERNNLHIKLNYIFSHVAQKGMSKLNSLYNEENEKKVVYIKFNNETDPDPKFSGYIKAKISLDKNNNLLLQTFSKDKNEYREEILFKNVKNIKYQFLANGNENLQKHTMQKVSNNIYWYNFWPKNANLLPSAIKIIINKKIEFAFFIPMQNVNMNKKKIAL
jgi:type II secretory pathway component PulJ